MRSIVCRIKKCSESPKSKDLCEKHRTRYRRHGNALISKKKHEHAEICSRKNCTRSYHSKGLCRTHYYAKKFKDSDAYRKSCKRYYEKLKTEVFGHYGGFECQHCGMTDKRCLSLDHINNDGAAHKRRIASRGGHSMYGWLKKANFPKGIQVLCMNCQWIKRANGGKFD